MRNKAATSVLNFRKNAAWHQARCGAAQNDVFTHKTLYVLKDVLLGFKLLKYTLLKYINTNRRATERMDQMCPLLNIETYKLQ